MHFSRREILKGMGAAGITPLLTSACSSSSGGDSGMMLPDLPELPEYQWDGPIGLENLFEHGVASGDPLPEGVILWTRVTSEGSEPVEVWWEMALDADFPGAHGTGHVHDRRLARLHRESRCAGSGMGTELLLSLRRAGPLEPPWADSARTQE